MSKEAAVVWRERARKSLKDLVGSLAPADSEAGMEGWKAIADEVVDSLILAAVHEARSQLAVPKGGAR